MEKVKKRVMEINCTMSIYLGFSPVASNLLRIRGQLRDLCVRQNNEEQLQRLMHFNID